MRIRQNNLVFRRQIFANFITTQNHLHTPHILLFRPVNLENILAIKENVILYH